MAKKLYKFIFKANKQGKWDFHSSADIKYNGISVGRADNNNQKRTWRISLKVPASEQALTINPNCQWMWAKVEQDFESKEDARAWLNEHRDDILGKLYFK